MLEVYYSLDYARYKYVEEIMRTFVHQKAKISSATDSAAPINGCGFRLSHLDGVRGLRFSFVRDARVILAPHAPHLQACREDAIHAVSCVAR